MEFICSKWQEFQLTIIILSSSFGKGSLQVSFHTGDSVLYITLLRYFWAFDDPYVTVMNGSLLPWNKIKRLQEENSLNINGRHQKQAHTMHYAEYLPMSVLS